MRLSSTRVPVSLINLLSVATSLPTITQPRDEPAHVLLKNQWLFCKVKPVRDESGTEDEQEEEDGLRPPVSYPF